MEPGVNPAHENYTPDCAFAVPDARFRNIQHQAQTCVPTSQQKQPIQQLYISHPRPLRSSCLYHIPLS